MRAKFRSVLFLSTPAPSGDAGRFRDEHWSRVTHASFAGAGPINDLRLSHTNTHVIALRFQERVLSPLIGCCMGHPFSDCSGAAEALFRVPYALPFVQFAAACLVFRVCGAAFCVKGEPEGIWSAAVFAHRDVCCRCWKCYSRRSDLFFFFCRF